MHRTTNPFAYPKPITVDSLGDLFAHHRARFGGFHMEDDDAAKAAAQAAADAKAAADAAAAKFEPITSQEDFDKRLGERLAREKTKYDTQYADYADLKKKAAAHDKAIEAARTDQEKAVEAAKTEGRTEALTAANVRLVSAEARALAAEAKFRNPGLAVRALDLKDIAVNDAGEVDADAVKAKLKELSDADPYLLDDGKKPGPKPDKAQGQQRANGEATVAAGRELWEERHGKKKTNA